MADRPQHRLHGYSAQHPRHERGNHEIAPHNYLPSLSTGCRGSSIVFMSADDATAARRLSGRCNSRLKAVCCAGAVAAAALTLLRYFRAVAAGDQRALSWHQADRARCESPNPGARRDHGVFLEHYPNLLLAMDARAAHDWVRPAVRPRAARHLMPW